MDEDMDVRKLTVEDLVNISGGSFSYDGGDTCTLNGSRMTIIDFNTLWREMAKRQGFYIACNSLHNMTGFMCNEMRYEYGDIETVLKKFWASYGR